MVMRFGRIGMVVIAAVVLAAQWPIAKGAGETGNAGPGETARAAKSAANGAANGAADMTVHEWGTFTTVAGEDGRAVEWLPLGGPVDLPCFVHSFNRLIKIGAPFGGPAPDYATARWTLKGTVRMETPVLYFYAPRPAIVDVSVLFRRGMFSEWYPNAVVNLPPQYRILSRPGLTEAESTGSMFWKDVQVLPNTPDENVFPSEQRPSHYYPARITDASPVEVNGEREKFLFYRGVAGFDSPIHATLADDGTVTLTNRSDVEIPQVMLFTRHGSQLGYRVHAGLLPYQEITLEGPAPDRSLDAVMQELEQTLVAQGLYVKEAQAMIATWRDSWFEDGTRLFYIVPPSTVDAVLPLSVMPEPKSIVRVFVGRAELIDAADIDVVTVALAKHDRRVLDRYGRLLGPIADRALAKTTSAAARADMNAQLDEMLKTYATRLGVCGAPPPGPMDTTALLRSFSLLSFQPIADQSNANQSTANRSSANQSSANRAP
jgi:hypothetical protein